MLKILKHLFKLQFLVILLSIIAGIYFPQILDGIRSTLEDAFSNIANTDKSTTTAQVQKDSKEKLFTKEELSKYDGADEKTEIYLSILGSVFDVSRGRKHYGAGCTYNMFAGRDASASFVTGKLAEKDELIDDVNNMKLNNILDLQNWREFYHKEYVYKGKLIGRFYDSQGEKTEYHRQFDELIELAQKEKEETKKEKEKFPPCNIEWKEETGTRVWCTTSSGGIQRDWVGVPRKLFDDQKAKDFRCACVNTEFLDSPKLREYENCEPNAYECFYRID